MVVEVSSLYLKEGAKAPCLFTQLYGRYPGPTTDVAIDELDLEIGQIFSLHYDYGDDWMFSFRVQKIEETKGRAKRAVVSRKGEVEQYPDWDDEDEEDDE